MKIKVGKNPAFDIRLIAAMREALPETMLMADANHAYDLPEAIRIGRVLDEHGFAWFEEPLSPEYEHPVPATARQARRALGGRRVRTDALRLSASAVARAAYRSPSPIWPIAVESPRR